MTSHDPSPRDELVAAYLDGEATDAERALVETDPELLAEVDAMRQVAALVAEPVVPPPLEVRNSHIAAALAASATAPNVTALAPRRRWANENAAILSVAAVILVALLAVPIFLVRATGGDDDDTATSILAGDAAEESANEATAESAFEALATTDADDSDDSALAPRASADEPAEEPAEEPAQEPAATPLAEEAAAAGEAPATEEAELADDGGAAGPSTFVDPSTPALLAGTLPNISALIDRVDTELAADPTTQRSVGVTGLRLDCETAIEALAGSPAVDAVDTALVGTALVDATPVEFAVVEASLGAELIVVNDLDCTTVAIERLELD